MREAGRRIVSVREPGGTAIGEQIRHLLQYSKENQAMRPETELLLFTASRAQLVREVIEPALHDGCVVVSDRFLDSTTVYQGLARRIPADRVAFINRFAVGEALPHVTFLLDLDPETARLRMLRRPRPAGGRDRMEEQDEEFYHAVRDGYLRLAEGEPERFVRLDARMDTDKLHVQILETLKERFDGILS